MIWVVGVKPMTKYPNDLGGWGLPDGQVPQMIWVVDAKPLAKHLNGLGGWGQTDG